MKNILLIFPLMACVGCNQQQSNTDSCALLDSLGISVSATENREYSYTDKKSGYWYGTTHQDSTFSGRDGTLPKNGFCRITNWAWTRIS